MLVIGLTVTTPPTSYYATLKPFVGFFETGRPCLTYHKLGPRPRGVRLKGLYVSAALFEKQLSELHRTGFTTISPGQLPGPDGNPAKHIALTFDDGFANVMRHGLAPLAKYKFRAIQYLVPDRIGGFNEWDLKQGEVQEPLMDVAQVKDWLAAGHEIGAHTLTHPFLTQISLQAAREEIFASKKKLEDTFAVPIRHFCYPYGDWNPAVRDLVVAAGYETATTVDFGINAAATPSFELKRITARYQSLNLKALKARFLPASVQN